MNTVTFHRLWDELLAEGVVSVTTDEIVERSGSTADTVYVAVHRAKREGWLFSPTRGLHVLVPAEYRSWGVVPAEWFIDDMMRHLDVDYYVGYLSAAALHGARHQAVQQFQVVSARQVKSRAVGRVKLKFYTASDLSERAKTTHTGTTGLLHVATPETCVLDLAERPDAGGGVTTLIEVVAELVVDTAALAEGAKNRTRAGVRRAGWILSRTHPNLDLTELEAMTAPSSGRPTPLVPGQASTGHVDHRWSIDVNTSVNGDQ